MSEHNTRKQNIRKSQFGGLKPSSLWGIHYLEIVDSTEKSVLIMSYFPSKFILKFPS